MKFKYILLILFYIACTESEADVEILAVVNGDTITKAQLVSRLELTPVMKSNAKMDLVEEAMNILIDEIVVSQWAKKRKLDHKEDYKKRISFTRKQALIRELFYIEIRDQSIPQEREINSAFQKSLQQITIEILFTQEKDISDEWSGLIRDGKTFTEIEEAYDGNFYIHASVVSYHWGDSNVPPKIQMVSYETKIGEMSNVFKVPLGYGILSVRNRVKDIFYNSSVRSQKRQEISKIIQARKEDMLASMYIEKLLENIKVEQIGRGFKEISGYLESMAYLNTDKESTEMHVKDLELKNKDKHNLSLVVIKSPDFQWNGNDVLTLLKQYNFSFANEGIESIGKSLTPFMKSAVRDYYLEKRAEHLGLESNVRVVDDIEMWSRYYLYLMGVNEMIVVDSKRNAKEVIREEIKELRSKASIEIDSEMIQTIRVTGIPMLGLWNTDLSKNLAVPPLLNFRN